MEPMETECDYQRVRTEAASQTPTLSDYLDKACAECVGCTSVPSCYSDFVFPYYRDAVSEIKGCLLFLDSPYYGFALKDSSSIVPVILANPMDTIVSFLLAVNCTVLLKNAHIIVERYQEIGSHSSKNFYVKYLEVHQSAVIIKNADNPVKELTSQQIEEDYFVQNIFILNVTTPIKSLFAGPYCLVLVKFLFSDRPNETKWIILRDEQVSWSVALFTGCKYELLVLKRYEKALNKTRLLHLCTPPDIEEGFKPFFHHPELFPTMNCCNLPKGTKLRLLSNTLTSQIDENLSVAEAKKDNSKLFSIVGQVEKVRYSVKSKTTACYMCEKIGQKLNVSEEVFNKLRLAFNPSTAQMNREIPMSGIIVPESFQLPLAEHQRVFGILGNLSKYIQLKDTVGNNTTGIYLKDPYFNGTLEPQSPFPGFLYPGSILPNSFVCLDNMQKKVAKTSGNIYFVSTPITRITILHQKNEPELEFWRNYGPPPKLNWWIPWSVFWFQSDLDNLLKVKITALCASCGVQFSRGKCSRESCSSYRCKIQASALVRVRRFDLPPATVILKDEHVQIFLGAKQQMWQTFCDAAEEAELLYYRTMDLDSCNEFGILFYHYCQLFVSGRFHMCVRILRTTKDELPKLFCLAISPAEAMRTIRAYRESN